MPTKVRLVKAVVFPVVMYGCESWTGKKAEPWRIDAFELWCWRRLLRVPWTARRFTLSILKEISPGYSLEGMMLKLKLQYFGHWCKELTHWKRLWCWEGLGAGGEGDAEDEMAGWHHQLFGRESEWTPGVGDGQGGLACCDSWGRKELDTTELNWNRTSFSNLFSYKTQMFLLWLIFSISELSHTSLELPVLDSVNQWVPRVEFQIWNSCRK